LARSQLHIVTAGRDAFKQFSDRLRASITLWELRAFSTAHGGTLGRLGKILPVLSPAKRASNMDKFAIPWLAFVLQMFMG
jgi:hypothetical protein